MTTRLLYDLRKTIRDITTQTHQKWTGIELNQYTSRTLWTGNQEPEALATAAFISWSVYTPYITSPAITDMQLVNIPVILEYIINHW